MRTIFYRFKNWFKFYKVKFFSLLSALFLWFYVVTDNRFNHTVDVPLHLVNKPAGWILSEPTPSKVQVLFRGKGKDLLTLGYRDKRIEIDLADVQREQAFPLTLGLIQGIPADVDLRPQRILDIDTVWVRLDRFAEKRVPIRSQLSLSLSDGYTHVGEISLEPDTILIQGPEKLLTAISEIPTVPQAFSNVIKKIDGRIELLPPEQSTVSYSVEEVRFEADVQRIGERIIRDIPVNVTHVARGYSVTVVPSTFSLTIQGGVNILSRINTEDIEATIDFRRRRQYRGKRIPAKIDVPEGITFSDARPASFELIVER